MALADEALREVFSAHTPRSITCNEVMTAVSNYYAVTGRPVWPAAHPADHGAAPDGDVFVPQDDQHVAAQNRRCWQPRPHHGAAWLRKIEQLSQNEPPVRAAVEDISSC